MLRAVCLQANNKLKNALTLNFTLNYDTCTAPTSRKLNFHYLFVNRLRIERFLKA